MLSRNLFPPNVIENVVRKFHNNNFPSDSFQSAAHRTNCLHFKLPYIGPFSITAQRRIKKLVSTFCSDLDIQLVFTGLKFRVGSGLRILSLRVYDRKLFISFHVQAVVPLMLVKPTDTSPLASANISPLTNIPTSLST